MDKSVLPGMNVGPELGQVRVGILSLAKRKGEDSPASRKVGATVATLFDIKVICGNGSAAS